MKTVTFEALIKRLNRKLAHEGEHLEYWRKRDQYLLVDTYFNRCTNEDVNVFDLALREGVLQADETVVY